MSSTAAVRQILNGRFADGSIKIHGLMRVLICEVVRRKRLLVHMERVCVVKVMMMLLLMLLLLLLLHMLVMAIESMKGLLGGLHRGLRRGHR